MASNICATGNIGALFVLLNTKEGMEFGIDMKCWEIGPNFKGVKMIPPGPHYIYYNHTHDSDELVYRKGFMHVFKNNEILARKWNPDENNMSMEELLPEEMDRLKSNIIELSRYLGPYPNEIWEKWKSLSNYISDDLINRLMPKSGFIQVTTDTVVSPNKEKQRRWIKAKTDVERQEDLLPDVIPVEGMEIRFTQLPEQRYPQGCTPSEITSHYLDATFTLQKMLDTYRNPTEFLGEIQFAFVCTLIGLNLEAFEFWKHLVQLVCSCEKAIINHSQLYSEFIACLCAQIEEIPMDFLVDIVTNDNVIYTSLRDFFGTLDTLKFTSNANSRLKVVALKLKTDLTYKFGWDFSNLDTEPDDEAPVIVDEQEKLQYY